MSTKRSRIIQSIPTTLARDLKRICNNRTISDNNEKVRLVKDVLDLNKVDYSELGAGTNRYAVLIDGYVFKIALDKAGMNDNANEFALSQELQPFVVKTYELSDDYVISVCEYVTVISQEEFIDRKDDLRELLSILGESYLLGDVGTVSKNFTNWGFRNNKELVILDFAYIFKVNGDELLCTEHQTLLEYDENFHNLYCPTCRRLSAGRKGNYSFISVRRRISVSQEQYEQELAIESAYKLTSAKQVIKEVKGRYNEVDETSLYNTNQSGETTKEDNDMAEKYRNPNKYNEEVEDFENDNEEQDDYLSALAALNAEKASTTPSSSLEKEIKDETIRADYPVSATLPTNFENINRVGNNEDGVIRNINILDVEKEDETQRTHVRVVTQRLDNDKDVAGELVNSVIDAVAEADELIDEATASENSTVLKLEGESSESKDTFEETGGEETHEHDDNPLANHDDDLTEEEEQEVMRRLYEVNNNSEDSTVDADKVVNDVLLKRAKQEDQETLAYMDSALKSHNEDVVEGEVVSVEKENAEVVLAETTVVVNDSISIKNTLSVTPTHDVDAMRDSLLDGADTDQDEESEEERVERLAEKYRHLEDKDDDNGQRRNSNKWS